jgi:hypothetical protein
MAPALTMKLILGISVVPLRCKDMLEFSVVVFFLFVYLYLFMYLFVCFASHRSCAKGSAVDMLGFLFLLFAEPLDSPSHAEDDGKDERSRDRDRGSRSRTIDGQGSSSDDGFLKGGVSVTVTAQRRHSNSKSSGGQLKGVLPNNKVRNDDTGKGMFMYAIKVM